MIFVLTSEMMHPYECSHDEYCIHCTLARTRSHIPESCALCDHLPDGHPDKGKPLVPMVELPYARRLDVRVLSRRYQKVAVAIGTQQRMAL